MDKTKNFIEKSTKIHDGYYTYENTVYVKANEKVNITCPVHGEFWQQPSSHINGRGCVKCRYKISPKKDPRDEMQFDLSSYEGMMEYIEVWELEKNPRALIAGKHEKFFNIIKEKTSFMDVFGKVQNIARLLAFMRGMEKVPVCAKDGCNSQCKPSNTRNVFTDYCSYDCSKTAEQTIDKIKKALSSPEVVEKKNKKTAEYYTNLAASRGYENPESYTHSSHFPDVVEKRKMTLAEKWECGHPMRDKEYKEKRKKAFKEKWGVDHMIHIPGMLERIAKNEDGEWFVATEEFRKKSNKTKMERYNTTNLMSVPSIVGKKLKTNMERYGAENHTQRHITPETMKILEDKEKLEALVKDRFFEDVANELGVHQSSIQRYCAFHGIKVKRTTSKAELEIIELLEENGINVEHSVRLISNREIDIYLPDHNVGIEFNGMYWHSDKFRKETYHQEKSIMHKDIGVLILHIWEDDWDNPAKKRIIINKILSKVGIVNGKVFARKTEASYIENKEAKDFYEENHIQGHVNGSMYIGLRDEVGELVACMTMKRAGEGVWDLSRFATKKQVVGGLGKCLAFFKNNNEWNEIFTFASLDYSHGGLYEATGFTDKGLTPPNMWYMKIGEWRRMGRRRFIKSKLPKILDTFDPDLTEKENMIANGYAIIHDAGSIKYVMSND